MYIEANTCLYTVKWVYTRRQTRLHEKANVCALYLASDLYCILIYLRRVHYYNFKHMAQHLSLHVLETEGHKAIAKTITILELLTHRIILRGVPPWRGC